MNLLIQYQQADQSWSPWTPCHLDGAKLMVNGEELSTSPVRVLKNQDPKNPDVSWYARHEQTLYEIKKSNTGFIEKAIPLSNQNKPIPVKSISGDFSLESFEEMKESAKDHLAPPLFTLQFIEEALIRPADATRTMMIAGTETAAQQAQDWWKDLYERYRLDVEAQLIQIIQDNPTQKQQIQALSNFLNDHYQFIQGTCLDFVAIPQHPVTTTLTRIAEMIEQKTNTPAIQLLMPGIATESIKDGYADLTDQNIPFILQSHIALQKGYLAPVRSLIEYVQPPNEIPYSPYTLEDYRPQALSIFDIQALFQHSSMTQELHDAFRTYQGLITQDSNLLGQLNILGRKLKLYDAHGGIGTDNTAAGGAFPAIMDFMQYYLSLEPCALLINKTPPQIKDLPQGQQIGYAFYQDQLYFLNAYEQTVSPITTPEHHAKFDIHLVRFQQLADVPNDLPIPTIVKTDNEQFTFFPGKKTLDERLVSCINHNFPSQYQHIINLSDANIPKSVFDAIPKGPRFVELFHEKFTQNKTLSQDELAWIDIHTEHSFMSGYSRVPEPVRNEIELLWQLFHNPAKNIEATQNMATCIGLRGEAIRNLSKTHEAELINISASPEQQRHLLDEAHQHLQSRLKELQTALDNQTYQGQDHHLSLKLNILNRFKKSIAIQSPGDVYKLNSFAQQDLMVLLDSNPKLLDNLKIQLNNLEVFAIYLNDTPEHILEVIIPRISELLISNIQRFPGMIGMLTPTKFDIIIQQSQNIITDVYLFTTIYQTLPTAHQNQLIEFFHGRWQDLIKNSYDFKSIYLILSTEHKNRFIASFQGRWQDLIKYCYDFKAIYETLPAEHQNQLIESLQRRWQDLIKNVPNFKEIYPILPTEHQNQVIESLQGRWQDLIQNVDDFLDIYETLPTEHQNQVIESLQRRWQDLIKDYRDFKYIYQTFLTAHQNQLFTSLEGRWQDLIKTVDNFADIYQILCKEHRNQLIEFFQTCWQDLIKTGHDISIIYRIVSTEHKNQLMLFLLQHQLGNVQSIQASINQLLEQPSNLWSAKSLHNYLGNLKNGIQELKNTCPEASIELFLQALLSQDMHRIIFAVEELIKSAQLPSNSFFKNNPEQQIIQTLNTYFPTFLPEKIENSKTLTKRP